MDHDISNQRATLREENGGDDNAIPIRHSSLKCRYHK